MQRSLHATVLLTTALFVGVAPVHAQQATPADLQKRVAEQDARIAALEARLAEQGELLASLSGAGRAAPVAELAASPASVPAMPAPAPATTAPVSTSLASDRPGVSRLAITGDARLREEINVSDADARDRMRTVFRARLRARYALSDRWSFGAGLVTGDSDDPNSADVTLTEFDDDLTVSLDQAWLRYSAGGLTLTGGKLPNPLVRTEMVWDGDVNPQGVVGSYQTSLGVGRVDAHAIYFIIDEAAAGPDSAMLGGQLALTLPFAHHWTASVAAAYYDYKLHALGEADAGDFRSNLIANGRYVSDFNLLNAIGTVTYSGLGERWPLSATVDWVRNSGAVLGRDSGINFELTAGRNARPGDWRLAASYSEVGVDAVFAAFSHDNIALATNYRMIALTLEHALPHGLGVGANIFHYRPLQAGFAGANDPSDWLDRIRFNFTAQF